MAEPKIARYGAYQIGVEEGKTYFWCSCGMSQKQPFCDGSHKGSAFKSFRFTAPKTQVMFLCGCKHTKSSPICDGSHGSIGSDR
jgi:CDGSH-type Zn-finger protein